jgi:hypothetical protein
MQQQRRRTLQHVNTDCMNVDLTRYRQLINSRVVRKVRELFEQDAQVQLELDWTAGSRTFSTLNRKVCPTVLKITDT